MNKIYIEVNMKNRHSIVTIIICIFSFSILFAGDLEYQIREFEKSTYKEGTRSNPVSAQTIELISVLADYSEKSNTIPSKLRLKFYLEKQSPVYITVRELNFEEFYWLSEVNPSSPFKKGHNNNFVWPTDEVIKPLKIDMKKLGVLARLNRSYSRKVEQVAPVIFYHSKLPGTIKAYLFTFKTGEDSDVYYTIFKKAKKIQKSQVRNVNSGRAFTLRWNASRASEGNYRLIVNGWSQNNSKPLQKIIDFYHKPNVK